MRIRPVVLVAALVLGGVAAHAEDGAAVFKARCARCHGETGKTDTTNARALKVRPLANNPQLGRLTPADIVQAIKTNPKHEGMGAVRDVDDADLATAAVFVKKLANRR